VVVDELREDLRAPGELGRGNVGCLDVRQHGVLDRRMLQHGFGVGLQPVAIGALFEGGIEHGLFPLRVRNQLGFDLGQQLGSSLERAVGGAFQFLEQRADFVVFVLQRGQDVAACHDMVPWDGG
jgi:hypothetical protein